MPSLLPSPRCALTAPFHPYRAPSAFACETLGGLLSVALSVGSRPPGVTWHLIRRSPDFPPPSSPCGVENSDCLAGSPGRYSSAARREVNFIVRRPLSPWAAPNFPGGRSDPHHLAGAARREEIRLLVLIPLSSHRPHYATHPSTAPRLTRPCRAATLWPTTPLRASTTVNPQHWRLPQLR